MNNTNMIRPFTTDMKNYTPFQQMPAMNSQANIIQVQDARLSDEMENLQQVISMNNQYMYNYMNSIDKRLTGAIRKKNRMRVSQFVCIDSNENICLRIVYDDETCGSVPFIINYKGRWEVYRLKFFQTQQEFDYFAIAFPLSSQWIVGKVCQNSGKKLYELFVKAGVKFNEQLSASRIQEALFLQFAPEIENSEKSMCVVEMAGWNNGNFVSANTYQFLKRQDFPQLPVAHKRFVTIKATESDFQRYFEALRNIKDWKNRFVMATYPLAGILASVFSQEHFRIPIYLNFVVIEEEQLDLIPAFMQIFNRDKLVMFHLDETERYIFRVLQNVNDEVVIFESIQSQGDTDYRRKKIEQHRCKLQKVLLGKCGACIGGRKNINAALVILSESAAIDKSVRNIFWDENFCNDSRKCMELLSGNTVMAILSEFVRYAGAHMADISSIIRNNRNAEMPVIGFWRCMMEILEQFWKGVGINICETVKLPVGINANQLSDEYYYNCENLVEAFVQIVRTEICEYTICEKKHALQGKEVGIFFDSEYLWLLPVVLEQMLEKKNIEKQKYPMLLELRREGVLKVDKEGFTRKLQVEGVRQETYQIRKAIFDEEGRADIIDLAREVL